MRSIGLALALVVGARMTGVVTAAAHDVVLFDDCKPNADG